MTLEEKTIKELSLKLANLEKLLNLPAKRLLVAKNKELQSAPDFWNDQVSAVKIGQETETLVSQLAPFEKMKSDLSETAELLQMVESETDAGMLQEINAKITYLEKEYNELEFLSLFSGPHDNSNAFISLHSGTGGVDAQDWTQMLERMYLRFAERQGWKIEILDRNYGNEAGLKSATLRIIGPWAYGYLKSENGVHRLLRNSPFNADGLRQTSFALVEVIPELKDDSEVIIKDEDIRIDVFRSSGPGGQSVNTTDSAVRLVHIPTGITISCQTERSQHQNKENAFKLLRTKLYQLAQAAKEANEKKLKGELTKAEWGRQIRSYFLYGNRLVKDHRSDFETSNVEAVLDGDLENFMEAYLRSSKK